MEGTATGIMAACMVSDFREWRSLSDYLRHEAKAILQEGAGDDRILDKVLQDLPVEVCAERVVEALLACSRFIVDGRSAAERAAVRDGCRPAPENTSDK